MKLYIKTLKGTTFGIEAKPEDKIYDVKQNIEKEKGRDMYPAAQLMLIFQGKVLKDETTLNENNIMGNSFVVIMVSKAKQQSGGAQNPISSSSQTNESAESIEQVPTSALVQSVAQETPTLAVSADSDIYGQAASNLVAGSTLETTIQQILDMGGGSWDHDTVVRALRAAYNNPERAVEYLYSGIPEQAEAQPVARAPVSSPTTAPVPAQTQPSSGPNADPLDLFPQGLPNIGSAASAGTLDFLRNSQQFQALRAMVQANPQILQPMLQELGKQNPQLMSLIQEHQADFLRLINEPVEGEGNLLNQLAAGMSQSVSVTPEEQEAIERLEAMGFDRALVLEVFFACNKNEELAANYLLDHMHEFDE